MPSENIRILIVDDTIVYRNILSEILSSIPNVEIAGTANNGKTALSKIVQLQPDLITLDIEMPVMDGLSTLKQIKEMKMPASVIMVSSHTSEGARVTMQALELGAFDFIAKPEEKDLKENINELRSQLIPKIKAFINKKEIASILEGDARIIKTEQKSEQEKVSAENISKRIYKAAVTEAIDIIAIGVSTGGPNALGEVIPKLPNNLNIPIVIVQHMPPIFTSAFADSLKKKSSLNVVEAENEQIIAVNTVYIAPGGKQMKIASNNNTQLLAITDDPPELFCKPSVNYLFRSVAGIYKNRSLGIIMTGMGSDGVLGLKLMKRQGAIVYAQDQASSVVFGMPMEAIKAGVVDKVIPLGELANEIINIAKKK